jgi:23S rRNA pseudouridine955/2504/2580 synthase
MSAESRTSVRNEVLGAEDAGQRVDRVLARFLPDVPRSRLFRLLRKGEVRLNGKRVAGEARTAEGDVLRVPPVMLAPPPPSSETAVPRVPTKLLDQIKRAIIHEDERLLVIDKPSGIAVHGGSGIGFGVIELLRAARPDENLELVHRLDRDTSGCLLVARKRSTLRALHALLREESFDKRYLAMLRGKWELGKKLIDAPLRTDLRVGGERTVKVAADGKESASEFKVVQFFGRLATLVEVRLMTGRTHQIRVHAAYAGHPVAGDDKYGDAAFNEQMKSFGLNRIFLHAHSIGYQDPERHVDVAISAPLPPTLKQVLDSLTGGAGKLKPAGNPAATPQVQLVAAPRKAKSVVFRPRRSGPASRSSRAKSRRGPRT